MEPEWSRHSWTHLLVRERVILRKLYMLWVSDVQTILKHQSKIDATSKPEQWGDKWNQNGSPPNSSTSVKHRCKHILTNRCETCDLQIDKQSSLGAPKGRQSDLGIRKRLVSGMEGSPGTIENRTLWPLTIPPRIPTRRWAEGPANFERYLTSCINKPDKGKNKPRPVDRLFC